MKHLDNILKMVDDFESLAQNWKTQNQEIIDKGLFVQEFKLLSVVVASNISQFPIASYSPNFSLDEMPMLWELDSRTFFDVKGSHLLRKDGDSSSFVDLYLLETGQYAEILTTLSEHSTKRESLGRTDNPLEAWGTREVLDALNKKVQNGIREHEISIHDLQTYGRKLDVFMKAGESK